MTKCLLFIVFLNVFLLNVIGQDKSEFDVEAVLRAEYRITPIWFDFLSFSERIERNGRLGFVPNDEHLIGSTLLAQGQLNISDKRKLYAGLTFGIRNDVLAMKRINLNSPQLGAQEAIKSWMTEIHFSLIKKFELKNKSLLSFELGHGFMNNGSNYTINEIFSIAPDGTTLYITGGINRKYQANFFRFSYGKKYLGISLAYYMSDETDRFILGNRFGLIAPSISYRFDNNRNKKVEH